MIHVLCYLGKNYEFKVIYYYNNNIDIITDNQERENYFLDK